MLYVIQYNAMCNSIHYNTVRYNSKQSVKDTPTYCSTTQYNNIYNTVKLDHIYNAQYNTITIKYKRKQSDKTW